MTERSPASRRQRQRVRPASGPERDRNWIKIVQRVPVRILIDPDELRDNPLRIGLSTTVSVDVSDRSGPIVASRVRNQPFAAKRGDGGDPAVDALISRIIAENSGSSDIAGTSAK